MSEEGVRGCAGCYLVDSEVLEGKGKAICSVTVRELGHQLKYIS